MVKEFELGVAEVSFQSLKEHDYVDSGLSEEAEEAEEQFQAKDLIMISLKTKVVIQRPSISRELLFQAISQYCSLASLQF